MQHPPHWKCAQNVTLGGISVFYNILNSLWEELARFRAVIALERSPGRLQCILGELGMFGALWVALSSKRTRPHNGRTLPPLLHVSGHVFRPNLRGAWKRERVHLPPETRNLVLGVISACSKSNTFSRSCTQGRQTPFHPGTPLPPRGPEGPPGPLGWGWGTSLRCCRGRTE